MKFTPRHEWPGEVEIKQHADRELGENGGLPTLVIYPLLALSSGLASELWVEHREVVLAVSLCTTLLGVLRMGLARALRTCQLNQLPRVKSLYSLTVVLLALCWSAYSCWAVVLYGRSWTGLLAIVNTVGIVAGAMSTLTPSLVLMLSYLTIMVGPSALAMGLQGGNPEHLAGAMVAFFGVFMAITGERHHRRYRNLQSALSELSQTRHQQEDLLAQEKHQGAVLSEQNSALTQARRAAEQANQAKSIFLATMSHEIRTPMNAIVGLTNLLLETETTEQQHTWLSALRDSSESLLVLISDILDLSKIEARQMKADISDFDFDELIEELRRLMGPVAQVKGLKLRVEIDESIPPVIRSDRLRLRQILLNLIGNAIKFSTSGTVSIHADRTAGKIELSVWDQGIGIAPESFSRLFQPFSQGDTRATRTHGGTGLGLVISSELSHLLGGSMWLSSGGQSVGEVPEGWEAPVGVGGSQFWVRLPLKAGKLAPAPEPTLSKTPIEQGPLKILVAEDNKVNQMVIRETLNKLGHEVHLVGSGKAALEALHQQSYPLVLMDLQMPEMDGLEATQLIRRQLGEGPWIVALTANAFTEDRERCLKAGMNDYLSKPVRREELEQAIQRARMRN